LIDVVTGVRLAGREAVAGAAAVRAVVLRCSWCARGENGGHGGGNGKKTKERLHQGNGQGPVGGYAVSSFRFLPGDSIPSERLRQLSRLALGGQAGVDASIEELNEPGKVLP
jgi:hypothetical protein